MAYSINRFSSPASGITVADGATNNTFDITIIGKGFTNYGEIIQENLVHMLENFNRTTAPSTPTPGQLWFNPSTAVLSVRTDGGTWKNLDDISTGAVTNSSIAAGAAIALNKLADGTSGQIIVADSGGTPTYRTMTGDALISNTGALSIAANSVGASEIITAGVQTIHMDASVRIATLFVDALTASSLSLTGNLTIPGLITTSTLLVSSSSIFTGSADFQNLSVSDLVVNAAGGLTVSGSATFATGAVATFNGSVVMNSNLEVLGSTIMASVTVDALTTTGTAQATYADLAERYESDGSVDLSDIGMVVVFGGENEITISREFMDQRVAGVISGQPAYVMNASFKTEEYPVVALLGRVPVKVHGPFDKGDLLVTGTLPGRAVSFQKARGDTGGDPRYGSVIGKALEVREDEGPGSIVAVVGRV